MYDYNEMYPDYLMHYGVKGMKWGVRRASKLQTKANIARDSAKEWDEKAAYASSKGKAKRAAKFKQNAADDRAAADKYQAKANKKVEKRYAKAGKTAGKADFSRELANKVENRHNRAASVLDKTAKSLDASGKYIRAEAARASAEAMRARGKNTSKEYRDMADAYMKRSDKLNQKASDFSKSANIDLGKNKVNSILESSRKTGYNNAKAAHEANRELAIESTLGSGALDIYNKARGK
jgi:hypothetical protein